jgi:predicted flap endonuclease-1-like 5' DNA nuclease
MEIMNKKSSPNFAIGFLIGLLLCIILWYWQKSTAAEDGALDLLERYAAMEKRVRHVGERVTAAVPAINRQPEAPPFDFVPIKGIGPVFNRRLHEAGITTLAGLTALTTDALAELLDIGPGRADAILAEAKNWQNA